MLKNYLLTLKRNIRSNPFIYLLNISGLAIGVAAFLFISLYAFYEYSYDQFHDNVDRVYRVNHIIKQEGLDPYVGAATFGAVGSTLVEELEQVEASTRLSQAYGGGIGAVDNPIEHDNILYAESSVFEIFSFPLVHGDRRTVLDNLNTVVISAEVARQHFGTTDCVGKRIDFTTISGTISFEVTGVFDIPRPSHLKADVFLSFSSLVQAWGSETNWNWRYFDFNTYIRVKPETNLAELDKQFVDIIDKYRGERGGSKTVDFDLIALTDIHLKSDVNQEISVNGDAKTVNLLLLIGSSILIIAWVNYVNLYTARANDRSKEVGIRKALGSSKKSLIVQFYLEAGVTNLFAIVSGFLVFQLINALAFRYLGLILPTVSSIPAEILGFLFLIWIVSVIFSGTYPALFISNFRTITSLKGRAPTDSGVSFRKALVVFQFMASGFMIGGTIVVFSQFQYMQNQPTGVDISNTVVLRVPDFTGDRRSYTQKQRVLRLEIEKINGVREVAASSDVPGEQVGWRGGSWRLTSPSDRKIMYKMTVDANYLEFLKVDFLAGRNFYNENDTLAVVINEESLYLYGYLKPEEAINQRVGFSGMDTMRIVGVISNFYQESLREEFKPTVYFRVNDEIQYMSVRVDNGDMQSFLETTETKFKEVFPGIPFTYEFMDSLMEARHQKEKVFHMLFNVFAALAIFLAFLGLLGLAFYTTAKRRKEAGIRKVLGSSAASIVQLVFRDFAKLVILGNLIAIPILWKLGTNWLEQFIFHVDFSWTIPVVTVLTSLVFAFAFTFFHLVKLGRTNPVEVLKDE